MVSEIFSAESFFWTCLWQSTIFIAAGLLGSFIVRHRSARAHQVLLLAMIAAVIVPVISILVKHYELGLFTTESAVIQVQSEHRAIASNLETPEIIPPELTGQKPGVAEKDLTSVITASENTKFLWHSVALYGWLMASLIFAARLLITFISGVRLLGRAIPLDCDRIEQAVHLAKAKLRINKDVSLYNSRGVQSPVIWCWKRKPILLLPSAAGQSDNRINWAGVLCHELAHYKRHDHISGLSAELIMCIMPWHPLLWWAKSRLIRLSEQACDDWVVATGQPCTDYAESLLDLTPCGQMAFVPAVVSSKKTLAGRVQRILKNNCQNPRTGAVWALTVTIVVACFAAGIAFAQTRPSKTEGQNAEEIESSRRRIISFPEDRSMGKLFARDSGQDSWYEGWQELGEAKGDVSVAAGKEVKLQISEQAAGDLTALDKLEADDLQMLSFGWKAMKVGSLGPIGNLKGLQALNIQRAKFDSEDFKHLTGLAQLQVLRCGDHKLTDTSMKYVGQLTSLRSLALWGTGISDEGLKHLQGLTNLTFLALNNCEITDHGLNYLRNMTALEGLQIYRTKITDNGLEKLRGLTRLKHINLSGNGITDAGLKHIENLTSLENIWIDSNPITDKGLSYLSGMKNLKQLYAAHTEITDAGLANLKGMKDFDHLLVEGIGDEGIRHLSELPALKFLQIQDAQVTKASVPYFKKMRFIKEILLSGDKIDDDLLGALRTTLPDCKIWDPQRSRDFPMAAWRQRFEAVYRLEDDQILKRISPPFIPERRNYYLNEHSHQASLVSRSPDRFVFHWDRKLKRGGYGFINTPDIDSTLRSVLGLNTFEYDGPEELLSLKLPGDWIVRDGTSQEMKLKALEQLLADEFGRFIRFEKRIVEQEVIVATGRFKFHPVPVADKQNVVHLYVDELRTSGGGTVHSVAELLQTIGNRANIYVVDRTEPSEENNIPYYIHRSSRDLRRMQSSPEKTEKLKTFLANLTEQTELQFEVALQSVEVWVVTENKEN